MRTVGPPQWLFARPKEIVIIGFISFERIPLEIFIVINFIFRTKSFYDFSIIKIRGSTIGSNK